MKKILPMLVFGLMVGGSLSAESQPHMKAALEALQNAKSHLQAASPDKGGHRAKALKNINEAIEQVKKGIAFDNRH